MNWRIQTKWFDGKKTNLKIVNDEPYFNLSASLEGDVLLKSNEELVKLGLEDAFKTIYVDKAMPEAIQKVDEYTQKVEEMNKVIAKAEELLQKVNEESETTQGALLEMGGQIVELTDKVEKLTTKEV